MPPRPTTRGLPRKRYTNDPFEGIDQLQDDASDGEPTSPIDVDSEEEPDHNTAAAYPEPEGINNDNDSGSEIIFEQDSGSESDSGFGSESEDEPEPGFDDVELPMEAYGVTTADKPPISRHFRKPNSRRPDGSGRDPTFARRPGVDPVSGKATHTRGLIDGHINKSISIDLRRLYFFGPSRSDYEPFKKAMKKWVRFPNLPSRTVDEGGFGGFHHSFYAFKDGKLNVDKQDWSWFFNSDVRRTIDQRHEIVFEQGLEDRSVTLSSTASTMSIVMGPCGRQKRYTLKTGQHLSLAEACNQQKPDEQPGQRNGFILNVGGKVRCTEWAPSEAGQDQYLAIGTSPDEMQDPNPESESCPPQHEQPCAEEDSIQIWRFRATKDGRIDSHTNPELHLNILVDWGGIRQLKWCQMPCDWDEKLSEGTGLGLLAGVWKDGSIRIISIPRDPASVSMRVRKAFFESRPPDTIFTSLAWVSPTRVAAGCANGCIAVWDLPTSMSSSLENPRPLMYSSVAHGHITNIVTCWPSRPDYLLITDMTGLVYATNLKQPTHLLSSPVATVSSHRTRHPNSTLTWNDSIQCAITTDDQAYSIRCHPIRRFWTMSKLGRCSSAAAMVACSPCHPYFLVCTLGGELICSNPLSRVAQPKGIMYQIDLFWHEWRALEQNHEDDGPIGLDKTVGLGNTSMVTDGEVYLNENRPEDLIRKSAGLRTSGISRITEGFRAERIRPNDTIEYNTADGVQFITVYESRSAVSAVGWNPNLHVGGWAAAGMADGLVRVEDLAV